MRFGFYLPVRGVEATPAALVRLLNHAETLGFHSVVIPDHIVQPGTIASKYPYTPDGSFRAHSESDSLDQLSLLAFAAGKTTTLRLITSVMVVPHRNPLVTAKALATIDVLSQGRLTLGVGVGWEQEEFAALRAADFHRRGAVTDEYLHLFKAAWTKAPAKFAGNFYEFSELWCLPQPVQKPHPPIWIGGESRAALRRVARLGDGWHPIGANPAYPLGPGQIQAKLDELLKLTAAAGRDPGSLTISYKDPLFDMGDNAAVTNADGSRRQFTGTGDQILDDIDTYDDLGVSELIFDFRGRSVEERMARMQQFAEVVALKPVSPGST